MRIHRGVMVSADLEDRKHTMVRWLEYTARTFAGEFRTSLYHPHTRKFLRELAFLFREHINAPNKRSQPMTRDPTAHRKPTKIEMQVRNMLVKSRRVRKPKTDMMDQSATSRR